MDSIRIISTIFLFASHVQTNCGVLQVACPISNKNPTQGEIMGTIQKADTRYSQISTLRMRRSLPNLFYVSTAYRLGKRKRTFASKNREEEEDREVGSSERHYGWGEQNI
jgi:hypothetical protein